MPPSELTYSRVKVRLHWGFSISYPTASKEKRGTLLPPPTTLVGALSYGRFRGVDSGDDLRSSPAISIMDKVRVASARFEGEGTYIEDIVRNTVSYFQKPERKADRRYMFNVVPTGRVYTPGGLLTLVYVTEIPEDELRRLSWSIIRLGSKEGLVSVEDVEVGRALPVRGKVRTSYYFRASVPHSLGDLVYADFWEGGMSWGKEGKLVRYAIPLKQVPLRSVEVGVEAQEAYRVGDEYVVVG
ncbi:type I-A CRISPR-associated protein Cas5a [Metallosphaera javensis (ex Hofmann et al. 2022)]|uniref:type I-A CRISPR-associated protein Cas5a n=1 Tax=Metallosphaera javensis (ex Hofmann et al. 2022) TaxID=99938 RepID=UPI001EDCFB3B|nr:type I-A CRISPR-associated protein Cas5a [Metallosphaera javensis (ex Hofmann et al. 2022)]